MNLKIAQLFIKFCVSYAYKQSAFDEGTQHLSQSKREELISLLEECLEMTIFLDTAMQIRIYVALGGLYRRVHQTANAIHSYGNLLALISGNSRFKGLEMLVSQNLGNIYLLIGEYHNAIKNHEKSLSIAKEIGNKKGERAAYGNLGKVYQSLGQYHKAIEYHEKSLSIAKEIGDRSGEGHGNGHLGNAYQSLGEYHKAIEYHEKRLKIAKEIGDRQGEGESYGNLGIAYESIGEYHKAIEFTEKTLNIAKEIGDRQGEGAANGNLGNAYQALGEYHIAIQYHEKRLRIAKEIGDRQGEGATYGNLGNVYYLLGEYPKAIQSQERSLNIAKEIDDRRGEGDTYGNLGIVYSSLGEYHKAIEHYEQSLSIAKEIGDRQGEGATYGSLGNAYRSLGEYHKAMEHHEKRLSIAKEIGDRQGEGATYANLGNAHQSLGENHKAIGNYKKSLSIGKEIGDRQGEGDTYGNLGNAYKSLGEYHTAIECLEKRVTIAKEIGDRQGEGHGYAGLGLCHTSLGEHHKAIAYYDESLKIAKEIGDIEGEAASYHNIGNLYRQETSLQDVSKSKEYLKKSITCFEKLFDDLKEKDQFKISIVDTFIKAYQVLSEVHIQTGQIEEALLVCERGRARALKDLLFFKYHTTEGTGSKQLKLADVKAISSHGEACILFYNLHGNKVTYHCWVISTRSPSTFFYDEMDNREPLATIVSSLSEVDKTKMKSGYFQYLVDNSFRQLHLREGIEYEDQSMNLSDHGSREPEAALTVYREVDRWCISADDEDDIEPLEMLSKRLLSPVINQLTHEEVNIIPDGPLFMVPFAALKDPETGKYLSETKRIRLAPSLTTLKILQESSDQNYAKSGALIIGNPTGDLPGAEKEAIEIGDLLGVQPLLRTQATKETVLKKLKQGVSVIHFAAHGSDKNGQIILAPSNPPTTSGPAKVKTVLTMKEVQESGIRAQLVVLSCCHTGKGDIRAEGVVGIARAFLAAGARAVVASLRAINDTATMVFMRKFYSHLKKGESASKSLQQAMREMREIEQYKEPRYWAVFFLIGNDVTIAM